MKNLNPVQKSHQLARSAGVMVGMAAGDALGAPYEFGPPIENTTPIGMIGGGPFGWAPGEWTDDTDMAIPIAQILSYGEEITDPNPADTLVAAWITWAQKTRDIGSQTSSVLFNIGKPKDGVHLYEVAQRRAQEVYARLSEHSTGGTGALMRTSPLALGYLDRSEEELAQAASFVAGLTHAGKYSAIATTLWTVAIRHAILTGELDIRKGMHLIPAEDRDEWEDYICEAEEFTPKRFYRNNGQVLGAFQGAYSAVYGTDTFVDAVESAVRGGGDTDTVAAIAGGLAGAYYGVATIPAKWRRALTGYGDIKRSRYRDLVNLAVLSMRHGEPDGTHGWPSAEYFEPGFEVTVATHPHDDGVYLGSLAAIEMLPEVDAIVSMSRVGTAQAVDAELIEFWLVDYDGENLNPEFTVADAAATIAELRAEGKTVLLHCYAAHSRTPSTAAAYSALHLGIPVDQAFREVCAVLPDAYPQPFFKKVVEKLAQKRSSVLQ